MNKLNLERKAQVIKVLCEGNSIRSTARITGTAINTVVKLLREVGAACLEYQDKVMHNLPCKHIQCDEIWSFVYSKSKNVPEKHDGEFGYGDVWTWTAIDADTKLVPCWLVGLRDASYAYEFMSDLKSRLANRVQITTDGHKVYLWAVEDAFGSEVDYAMLVKLYGQELESETKYSPAKCIAAEPHVIQGNPDPTKISTSFAERQNLTMRMSMRRFTRLTNAFSKKLENHRYALALYFMHYNFVRPHKTLAYPYPRTPAIAAGLTEHIWEIEEIVKLVE
ncbi:MAG: IS1 family transposase [Dehalococcoidia bacterium]|nr:IS1 family transposase [Dehalococcoidia bacterium]